MAENTKKPAIRFAGFSEAWEQRKLSDLVDVIDGDRGKNYPTESDFDISGHTLFLNASNVTTKGFALLVRFRRFCGCLTRGGCGRNRDSGRLRRCGAGCRRLQNREIRCCPVRQGGRLSRGRRLSESYGRWFGVGWWQSAMFLAVSGIRFGVCCFLIRLPAKRGMRRQRTRVRQSKTSRGRTGRRRKRCSKFPTRRTARQCAIGFF